MDDHSALLHNMSSPPKSVVKYSGLSGIATGTGPGGSGLAGINFKGSGIFGTPLHFALPAELIGRGSHEVLLFLKEDPGADPDRQLAELINARARELPLPEGCAVIPGVRDARCIWTDALSVLAILAKCSNSVWLRAKTPAFHAAMARQKVTLLVPPKFARFLPEVA